MPDVPPALGWTVLALVFLDELLLVAGAWVAAAAGGGWVVGLLAGVAVVALWAALASPKAPYGGPVARPVTQVLLLVAVCLGLWWAGHPGAALALAVFSVTVNALARVPSIARLPQQAAS